MDTDGIRAEIGRRIRNLRLDRGMSQVMLADAAELSRVNLSRIERGKAAVMITTLLRITRALGVTLADLVQGIE
jgi:transcriptional regulator with XRE-family HTH domain